MASVVRDKRGRKGASVRKLAFATTVGMVAAAFVLSCFHSNDLLDSGGTIRLGAAESTISIKQEARDVAGSAPVVEFDVYAKQPCFLRLGAGVERDGLKPTFRAFGERPFRPTQLLLEFAGPDEAGWVDRAIPLPPEGITKLRLEVEGGSDAVRWARPRLDCPRSASQSSYYNVVLVSLDTLRADRVGAYGGRDRLTPNMDRIAEQGTVFERVYAAYPNTLSSHASLFSGKLPSELGVLPGRSQRIPAEAPMLAEVFAAAGYSTAAFTENGFVASRWGFSRGFDRYHDGTNLVNDSGFAGNARETFGRAIGWLAEKSDSPVFLFIQSYEVHVPYSPPRKEVRRLSRLRGHRYQGMFALSFTYAFMNAFNIGQDDFSVLERSQIELLYDAEVRTLDAEVGRLDQAIRDLGIEDETILVLFSDHGEEFFEHGFLGHGNTLHEQALRVPLIVRGPKGSVQGKRIKGVAGLIDVSPTVLELSGVEAEFQNDASQSLAKSVLDAEVDEVSRLVVSERVQRESPCPRDGEPPVTSNCEVMSVSLRDGAYTYILDQGSGEAKLFHVASDPSESRNLADQATEMANHYSQLVAELPRHHSPRPPNPADPQISEELERNLRALGYVE